MKNEINVISCFNGMGCIWIALDKLGIKVNKRYSSEIDKYANIVNNANYPDTIQMGDITKWKEWDIEWDKIDLIVGGSPCQGFSFAGKGLNFLDPRSKLFFVFVEIIEHCKKFNPGVKFLLENVRMKEEHEKVITKIMQVKPIMINSALVSAQNRVRLYWTNIGLKPFGLFGNLESIIPQPKDKGILLRDILESEVDSKYYLSEKIIAGFEKHALRHLEKKTGFAWNPNDGNRKGVCLRANAALGATDNILKIDKKGNIKDNQDNASCFTAGGHSGGNHSDMDLIVHNTMPRSGDPLKGGTWHLQRNDGKTYCLDTGNTNAVEIQSCDYRYDEGLRKTGGGKSNCLTVKSQDNNGLSGKLLVLYPNSKIRRLTPIECERLQTVPDNYTNFVSDSQRYKMLGNGWTVYVIVYILSYL